MSLLILCRRIVARFRVRTRYTRALEEEVTRLRAENHALVNSILGVAGIPPMRIVGTARALQTDSATHVGSRNVCGTETKDLGREPRKASLQPDTNRPARRELHAGAARPKTGPTQAADTVARDEPSAALRRRSWQQIERVREIEDARAARREKQTDIETFPAPRNIVPRV